MYDLPSKIYSVAAVREMDRIAIEDRGVPGYTLMQRAGAAAVADAFTEFADTENWQVVCGGGNNGGDGYVVARLAAESGLRVSAVALVDPASLTGDALRAHADFVAGGGTVLRWDGELDPEADLVVDAILGSGLERDVVGDFAAAVDAVNWHTAPVHALDIPSGVNGDSGRVMGKAVTANLTTTFVGLKTGLFLGDGPDRCGLLEFADLDIPPEWLADITADYRRFNDLSLFLALPHRPREAHKGDFGHVLVVGGGLGMPGAALLCGTAALRCGAGRVSLATHPEHAGALAAARPELMCHGVSTADELQPLLERADVVAFGPGLGQTDWARALYSAMNASEKPAVWDADALNLLADSGGRSPARIITPHPGEAARLLNMSAAEVQKDRPAALASLSERYGGTAVLKGAGTLVSTAGETPVLCTSGNPGMASPGMGDVLTGVIAALLAQGLPGGDAAAVGVEVHARSGDLAAEAGERGMTASDVIDALRWAVNP